MMNDTLKIFALKSDTVFAKKVAERLNNKLGKGYDNIIRLSEHEEYSFSDGECYIAPKPGIRENVRGGDVFLISSMYTDQNESVNDKIMKTFILCGALRDASAKRITLVAPYYPYARQDRKTNSRAPITTKYLARLFNTMWVDRLLTLDVHNPTAIQNAFQIPCDLLEANRLFADHILKWNNIDPHTLTILSPDAGGLGRARKFRKILNDKFKAEIGIACMDKVHQGFNITGYDIMGVVKGKNVIIYDDMISSAKTVSECIKACFPDDSKKCANSILGICATHGLFVGNANENLADERMKKVVITDTIQPYSVEEDGAIKLFRLNEDILEKLEVINTTELFAEAISRIHNNDSISDLLSNGAHH